MRSVPSPHGCLHGCLPCILFAATATYPPASLAPPLAVHSRERYASSAPRPLTRTPCSLAPLQFLTGAQIQAAQIPFLPQGAQIISAWFATLPLVPTTYYIPGAILAVSPVSIGYDPATGAAPSVGTGIVFAMNP